MQRDLASMLQQKSHLAALGLAVSKINHDLRNLLTSAQLFSERLATVSDPHVQRFAPKLMRALERAIAFCQSTLSYGRVQEAPPDRRAIALEPAGRGGARDARPRPRRRRSAGSARSSAALMVDADPEQLFRILLNLARNAVQALESRAAQDPGRDQVRITGRREGAVVVIEVSDTGPGLAGAAPARTCSRRSRARPAPAAPGSGSPSRPSWCAPTAARSAWSTAPSGRPSASPSRTARSSSTSAASGRAREGEAR